MFKIKKELDKEKDKKSIIIKKKENNFILKIDELIEKQFKNYIIEYFN